MHRTNKYSALSLGLIVAMLMGASLFAQDPGTESENASQAAAMAQARQPKRFRVAEDAQETRLVHMVPPVYPPLLGKRMDGTVVLRVIIGENGSVKSARSVSGPQNLRDFAANAVLQWKYKQMFKNGEPIEVDTTVSVVFPPPAREESPATKKSGALIGGLGGTLWIAADANGKVQVLAKLPHLVVPRENGFWHVGITNLCSDEDRQQTQCADEVFWAKPVEKAAEFERQDPSEGNTNGDERECDIPVDHTTIQFVSPELISLRQDHQQTESCEPRGGRYSWSYFVRRFDSEEPLSFGKLFGTHAAQLYRQALPETATDEAEQECGGPGDDDKQWRISHEDGRWRAFASQNLGFDGCSVDAAIRFGLPSRLTGEPAAVPNLKAWRARVPDLADAFASPTGDLAIILTKRRPCQTCEYVPGEMRVYELVGSVPGKLLLTLPPQGIVMVQWATGAHVREWTARLQQLEKQGLPEPLLRTVKKEVRHNSIGPG